MRLACSIALAAALPVLAAADADPPFWTWRSEGKTVRLDIDLIRARIEVVRRDGPIEVEIERGPVDGRAAEAGIAMEEKDGFVAIRDHYPHRTGTDECLPPEDERGDYWTHIVRFRAVVRAPRSVRVTGRVKDGTIVGLEG